MHWILLIGGGGVVLVGLALTSQATMGAAVIAAGCYLAIAARIVQAAVYQRASTQGSMRPSGRREPGAEEAPTGRVTS
jgi:hypothetical protein